MNPLLYKAHPLLYLTVDWLANPAAHSWQEARLLALLYFGINLIWALLLRHGVGKIAGFSPGYFLAYWLALPALLLYLPPMATILQDVTGHQFHLSDRFILVFCVLVASQMLGAFYAVAIRYPRNGIALGLSDGIALSLWLWLFSLPLSLALLLLNNIYRVL